MLHQCGVRLFMVGAGFLFFWAPWPTGDLRAAITRQVWTNIRGSSLGGLLNSARFPLHPDKVETIDRLATRLDWGDNYGERLAGYLVPPTSGTYTFWIASDDAGVLRLSTDDSPTHLAEIARVTGYTAPEAWDGAPEQKSRPIRLIAGRVYFLEILHKEGGGRDHLAVAWQGPSIPRQVVPGTALRPLTGEERYPVHVQNDVLSALPGASASVDLLGNDRTYNVKGRLRIDRIPPKTEHGARVRLAPDGRTAIVDAPADFVGLDGFTYRVVDGVGPPAIGHVAVIVTAAVDAAKMRLSLLRGVRTLEWPAPHGCVAVAGRTAFGVIRAPDGRTLVAAACWGRGRTVLFGAGVHAEFSKLGDKADNGVLYRNAVLWAAGNKPADDLRVVTASEACAAWLRAHGIARARSETQWIGTLKKTDVLVLGVSSPRLSAAKVKAIARFVAEQGGGLVAAGKGRQWAWTWRLPELPANRLVLQAGLGWAAASVKKLPMLVLPEAASTRFANAVTVLDRLRTDDIAGKTNRAEAGQALTALRSAFGDEHPLWKQARGVLLARARRITPGPRHPVRDPLDRIALDVEAGVVASLPPEQVEPHRTAVIYGKLPENAPRVTRTLSFNITKPALGTYGQPFRDRWLSTGLYAAPGDLIAVTVPEKLVDRGVQVRINGDWNDLRGLRDVYLRMPFGVSRLFPVQTAAVKVANAYGGLIYLQLPREFTPGRFQVRIAGAVEAPVFVMGKDTNRDWIERLSKRPGPWGEIITPNLIVSTASSQLRNVRDMEALAAWWNSGVLAQDRLAGTVGLRTRPERMVNMIETAWGGAYASYPIGAWNWEFGNLAKLKGGYCWGHWHEMGHLHQRPWWTFSGTGEVTVNIFSMYAIETICDPPRSAGGWGRMWDAGARADAVRRMIRAGGFDKVDLGGRLVMYRELREAFGWDAFKKTFRDYLDAPEEMLPKTDTEKRDQWMIRFSKSVGRDLGPFFATWKLGVTDKARRQVAALKVPGWNMVEVVDDVLFCDGGRPVTFSAGQLLANDLAIDGKAIHFAGLHGQPVNGTLETSGDDRWTYTPDAPRQRDRIGYSVLSAYGDTFKGTIVFRWRPKGGLAHHWPLDETSGPDVADTAGRSTGKPVGGVRLGQSPARPALGRAVYFNGADAAIELPALGLDTNTLTVTAWVKRDGHQSGWNGIFFCRGGKTVAGLNLGSRNELRYHWNGGNWSWDSKLVLPDRQWVFVALVIEPSQAVLWLDGKHAVHKANHGPEEFDAPACIGAEAPGRRPFKGWIDDVRVYVKSLSDREIRALRTGRGRE